VKESPHVRPVALLMFAASVLALALAVISGVNTSKYAHCQARVNQQMVVAQNARAAAAEVDRDAIDQLVSDVVMSRTAADTLTALNRYQATRAAADEARRQHPLPAPPSQVC
jgi:hypothetical protein